MPLNQAALKLARKMCCLGHQEPAAAAEAALMEKQPGPEPDQEEAVEPGRPYRDTVEAEARQYWEEITNIGSLIKPGTIDLYDILALRQDAMYRAIARNNYALAEAEAMQPGPAPGTARNANPARPHQDFVESEARIYWQEMGRERNLTKPDLEEIRAAALPILCLALRNRFGNRRHRAVADMVQYARHKGWVKWPYSGAHESPSYIDALIRLADDANWLAREIPLPDHPPPKHPPIYYILYSRYGRLIPVPRPDAIIRGDYLHKPDGSRVTDERHIYPLAFLPAGNWRHTWSDLIRPDTRALSINPVYLHSISPVYYGLTFERARKPVNRRGVYVWFDWKEETGEKTTYHADQLRDFPYPSDLVFFPNTPRP